VDRQEAFDCGWQDFAPDEGWRAMLPTLEEAQATTPGGTPPPKQEARAAASAPVSRPGAWPRSNGADPKTKPVKNPVAGGPRQDTVPFLSCLEEQKLRFQGQEHSAALRVPVRLGGKS
jgi:hypothetical protein